MKDEWWDRREGEVGKKEDCKDKGEKMGMKGYRGGRKRNSEGRGEE